jgi:hypothetical protein
MIQNGKSLLQKISNTDLNHLLLVEGRQPEYESKLKLKSFASSFTFNNHNHQNEDSSIETSNQPFVSQGS